MINKKRDNRVFVLCILITYSFLLSSCVLMPTLTETENCNVNADKQAREWGTQIMKNFINKDEDALKSMYSLDIQNRIDLENEIPKLYNFLDGEIVSYDEPFGTVGGATIDTGITVEKSAMGHISNVVTDKGTTYEISYAGYVIYREDESYLGIDGIVIRNWDLFDYYKNINPDFYRDKTKEEDMVEIMVGVDRDEQ